MSVAAAAISRYEQLRAKVVSGQAGPEGRAAIAYHGMFRGLAMILTEPPDPNYSPTRPPASDVRPLDQELLRLLANMVLQSQSEIQHVY